MERAIFDKMNESMEKYLQFVLKFMARQSEVVEKSEFTKLKLDRIPYSIASTPMARIKVQIEKKPPQKKEPNQNLVIIKGRGNIPD